MTIILCLKYGYCIEVRKYSIRAPLKPAWMQDAAKSAGTSRSTCRGLQIQVVQTISSGQLAHIVQVRPPQAQIFQSTKDSQDDTIGLLGLTPPLPTITHAFPDRLLGVNKSTLGHFTVRQTVWGWTSSRTFRMSPFLPPVTWDTPMCPSIFNWSACLYNKVEMLPPAVTPCTLQPDLLKVILIMHLYVHVHLCKWNNQTSSTFYWALELMGPLSTRTPTQQCWKTMTRSRQTCFSS